MRIDLTSAALAWGALRHWGLNSNAHQEPLREEPLIGVSDQATAVYWPAPSLERASSVLFLGGSGTGKSVMLGNALAQEIGAGRATLPAERQPGAYVIIPKSDQRLAIEQATAALAPAALANMVCLDPFSPTGFPFNLNRLRLHGTPIEIRAWQLSVLVAEVSTATGMLRSGSAGAGARQIDVLNHLLLAALTVDDPRANVLLAYDALITPQGFERLASLTTSERARGFLLATKLGDELAASCSSRLRLAFAATDSLERMIGSPDCVQFDELIAPGRLCLIDIGKPFGGMPALQIFWASLFAALGIDHVLARPAPFVDGHHVRIVIDEIQVVASVLASRVEALATTGRARNSSLALASQGTALLDHAASTLVPTLMSNCPTKLIGRLASPDAELLSREITTVPGNPERPKLMRERFAAAVSNLPDRRFYYIEPSGRRLFTSAPIDMARWQDRADEHQAAITAAERRLALPTATPERTTLAELTAHFDAGGTGARGTGQEPRSRWG